MSVETLTNEEERISDETEKEVKLEEVAELEEPIKKIIEKIKDRIEGGEYGLIIGDDASGRIPTLILGNFIKKISEIRGVARPNIIFIPGKLEMESDKSFWRKIFNFKNTSQQKQHEELDEYILTHGGSKDKEILIITDSLLSGTSLRTLVDLLKQIGYNLTISTIGIEPPLIGRGYKESLLGANIVSGEYRPVGGSSGSFQNVPSIYNNEPKRLSGVYKNPGDKVSKTIKSSVSATDPRGRDSKKEIQDSINQAREDASVAVGHLIDWYESQKK